MYRLLPAWQSEARLHDAEIRARAAEVACGRPCDRAVPGALPRSRPEPGNGDRAEVVAILIGLAIVFGALALGWWGMPVGGSAQPAAGARTEGMPRVTESPDASRPAPGFLGGFEARAVKRPAQPRLGALAAAISLDAVTRGVAREAIT